MTPVVRRVVLVAGVALVVLAVATCLALGTIGWAAVGFGVMTDCTNEYSCSTAGCPPCAATSRWITLGGLTQLGLAVVGVVVLVRAVSAARVHRRPAVLVVAGVLLLATSLVTLAVTTAAARGSYCRVASPGDEDGSCATGD